MNIQKSDLTIKSDLELDESPKIVQQLLSRNPPPGGNFVQIVYLNNIVPSGNQKMTDLEIVRDLLMRLDPPRLKHLKDLAYSAAMTISGGNKVKTAEWLGISRTALYLNEEREVIL